MQFRGEILDLKEHGRFYIMTANLRQFGSTALFQYFYYAYKFERQADRRSYDLNKLDKLISWNKY